MPSPRPKTSRTAELAATYGRRIASGALRSGDALPIESELASEWGVSRTVVREAMRLLGAKGLIKVGPKVGTRVLPAQDWNMLDPDVMAWHLFAEDRWGFVSALYEMRLINEPPAARIAAQRITQADRERLREAFERMERYPRGSSELIAADLDFHRIILEATGNPILRSLGAMIEKSLSISFSLSWRQNPQVETLRQHQRVLDAILGGDAEAAELFMRRLIESAFEDVSQALEGEGGRASEARRRVGDPAPSNVDNALAG
ncbi:FadR family transcriptional regulator [Fulvimarina endophytica]|uniref:FadR family transcriptional regulator n=1 Tax=Fulvimarina endophytica TaxID=2293836 RepID=A0A371WZB5_9HYPH|nr:FadR/GntR family transcriptional regulator [Fulvimarina endophytica]RFC62318.1 FadR family transcriptional regulator [Fulvimarina endophytica]